MQTQGSLILEENTAAYVWVSLLVCLFSSFYEILDHRVMFFSKFS